MNFPFSFRTLKTVVILLRFFKHQSMSGFLLFGATILALLTANSPWAAEYFDLWHAPLGIAAFGHTLTMDLTHWIDDGLMSLFFLLVGLEIKRELLVGELSTVKRAAFPIVGAIGGMLVPALLFFLFTSGTPQSNGFGIPMATDIAFVLGILTLFGNRVSVSLKIFLVSLAVVDDLGAVLMIAFFYTDDLLLMPLFFAGATLGALTFLNAGGVTRLGPYLLLGILLWVFIHSSGVHATVAGVLLAFLIPVRSRLKGRHFIQQVKRTLHNFSKEEATRSNMLLTHRQHQALEAMANAYDGIQNPLMRLEHFLQPVSAYFVMPLFAFANAGISFSHLAGLPPLPMLTMGIIAGLVVGKPLGIAGFTYLFAKIGVIQKPRGLGWKTIIGGAVLGGVGFTMSIFIAQLAFDGLPAARSRRPVATARTVPDTEDWFNPKGHRSWPHLSRNCSNPASRPQLRTCLATNPLPTTVRKAGKIPGPSSGNDSAGSWPARHRSRHWHNWPLRASPRRFDWKPPDA